MHIIGFDPGAQTGVAVFSGGNLKELETIAPLKIAQLLRERLPDRVVFEDSRLETRAWNARSKASYGAALATARSLGQVDAWCSLIVQICEELQIPAHGISPARKGAKLDARAFCQVTGYQGRCNQHERDAAMVVMAAMPLVGKAAIRRMS